ncbi:MAG: hypothetical protein ACKV1O_16020 [Saprospiraceae bacterium]
MANSKRLADYRHLVPLYGDITLFTAFFKGELWVKQYQIWIKGDKATALLSLGKLFGFFIAVYAFPVRVFLRYRHGIFTIGWFLTAYTALTIVFFNWAGRGYRWPPLYTLYYPFRKVVVLIFNPNALPWWPDMITRMHSQNLWWFCLAFCALATIHILISYFTVKGDEQDIRRGTPALWKLAALFFKRLQDKDRLAIWWILESLLLGGIGAYLFFGFHDRALGMFLIYASACHFALECYESIGLARFISR